MQHGMLRWRACGVFCCCCCYSGGLLLVRCSPLLVGVELDTLGKMRRRTGDENGGALISDITADTSSVLPVLQTRKCEKQSSRSGSFFT